MQDALKRPGFPIAGQAEPKAPEAAKGEINGIKIPEVPKPVELAPARPAEDYDRKLRFSNGGVSSLNAWHKHTRAEFDQGMAQGRPVFVCSCGARSFDKSRLCYPSEALSP